MGRRLTLHLTRSHSNWFKTKRDIDYKVTMVFYGLPRGQPRLKEEWKQELESCPEPAMTLFVSVPSKATCMPLSACLSTPLFLFSLVCLVAVPMATKTVYPQFKRHAEANQCPNSLSKYLGEKIWLVSLCRFHLVPSAIGQGGRGTQCKHGSWMRLLRLGGQFWKAGVRLGRFHRKSGLNWIDQEPWNLVR